MPGSMIHLLVANKVNPDGSALFYLGNIAPDAVVDWHDKDISHFRDLDDRELAIALLAKKTEGDFAEGILLHLYFDWKWDTIVRQKFMDKISCDWFPQYRNELSFAGSYGKTPRASVVDVKDFVGRNNKWHNENVLDLSPAFPPDLIDDFTTGIAKEYIEWRKNF